MNKQLKLLAFVAFLALGHTVSAQISAQLGLNISSVYEKVDANVVPGTYTSNFGFHVGGTYNWEINDYLSLEPGLQFTTKGAKGEASTFGASQKSQMNLYYIDLPVRIRGNYAVSDKVSLYGAFGPYLGFGLAGKHTSEINSWFMQEKETVDLKFGNGEGDHLKGLEAGLSFGLGATYQSFLFGLNYELGLTNNLANPVGAAESKNRVFSVSFGYYFNQ